MVQLHFIFQNVSKDGDGMIRDPKYKANRKAKCEKRGKIHEQRRADKRAWERKRKALLRYIDNINKYGVPYAEKGRS